ncbi:Orn/Lys/Arg decarboxylase N-terminal domain-containing protein [Piscirickettsia litoralis]|uniref:Orn/Lys/Arg decarboxylase N-terminal domain-containing protein n=1 Tax=Piscirickettsia litoralis TaxID=1891921 RepID=UPI001112F335|nr:Orn/Lys/Arg decarboxylase N-terminal domain-containing protein [Piscirickettsia litoralis]
MKFENLFKFLLIDAYANSKTHRGEVIQALSQELKKDGFSVDLIESREQAKFAIEQDIAYGCILVDFDSQEENGLSPMEFVDFLKNRGLEVPIFAITERHKINELNSEILGKLRGAIVPHEDTPEFIAKYVARAFHEYIKDIKTPFLVAWLIMLLQVTKCGSLQDIMEACFTAEAQLVAYFLTF